eukprot:scaffold22190_cov90-Isochrysis_galbana.AAC.1
MLQREREELGRGWPEGGGALPVCVVGPPSRGSPRGRAKWVLGRGVTKVGEASAPLLWTTADEVCRSVVTQKKGVTESSIFAAPRAPTTARLKPSPVKYEVMGRVRSRR